MFNFSFYLHIKLFLFSPRGYTRCLLFMRVSICSFCSINFCVLLVTKSIIVFWNMPSIKKRRHYQHDNMVYNRAELMRLQAEGIEIVIGEKSKNEQKLPQQPPNVVIKNLNVISNPNINQQSEKKEDIIDDDNKDNKDTKPISSTVTDKGDDDNNKDEKYELKENIKTIEIRHQHHWFIMTFENDDEFYKFLDKFKVNLFANSLMECIDYHQERYSYSIYIYIDIWFIGRKRWYINCNTL